MEYLTAVILKNQTFTMLFGVLHVVKFINSNLMTNQKKKTKKKWYITNNTLQNIIVPFVIEAKSSVWRRWRRRGGPVEEQIIMGITTIILYLYLKLYKI